jgi:DNA-binding response OmpR family regulator
MLCGRRPDIRELVTFMLRFAALKWLRLQWRGRRGAAREIPDLVIMDVRMPRMTGYDACRLMKANPDLRHVPVVFLSAKGQESEIQSGLDAGADEYLLKPFSPAELTNRVRGILSRYGK